MVRTKMTPEESDTLGALWDEYDRVIDERGAMPHDSVQGDNPLLTVTPALRENLKRTGQAIAGIGALSVMQPQNE